jgi:hypothetical protein
MTKEQSNRTFGPIEKPPLAVYPPYDRYIPDAAGREANEAALRDALIGIGLGSYDDQIVEWLATWESSTVAVVVSLLERVRAAGRAEGGASS